MRHLYGFAITGSCASVLAACASTGATLGSGVGDRLIERPPYYAGAVAATAAGTRVGHLPITYQRGASHSSVFDPAAGDSMLVLLTRMNAFLDSLGVSTRLVEGGRVSAVAHAETRFPPDVRFGCETVSGQPDDECTGWADGDPGPGRQPMHLSVARPSAEWTAWLADVMHDAGVDRALVLTIEVGHYLPRQRGLRGTKVVELGTDHEQQLPWLTSLETPLSVLQLTGAVVTADGKAVRIGAEGMLARRTSLTISALGGQTLMSDEDVIRLMHARRDDVDGAPLVWQSALGTMVDQLVGTPSR